MVSRKMHTKFSFRIIFVLTILQIMYGFVSCTSWTLALFLSEHLNCFQVKVFHLLPNLTSYISHGTVLFLAFDRFLRVNFMEIFKVKITGRIYYFLYCTYMFIATLQAVFVTFGRFLFGEGFTFVIIFIDLFFVLLTLTFYVLSILKLRKHQEQSRNLSNTDRDITKLTRIYLYIIVVCYVPYLIIYLWQVLDDDASNRRLGLSDEISDIILSLSGIANAVTFLRFAVKRQNVTGEVKTLALSKC